MTKSECLSDEDVAIDKKYNNIINNIKRKKYFCFKDFFHISFRFFIIKKTCIQRATLALPRTQLIQILNYAG